MNRRGLEAGSPEKLQVRIARILLVRLDRVLFQSIDALIPELNGHRSGRHAHARNRSHEIGVVRLVSNGIAIGNAGGRAISSLDECEGHKTSISAVRNRMLTHSEAPGA